MAKLKVLVIEDDRSLSDVLSYNLKQAGYEVLVASDGQDGLLQAQIKSPDIVILDLMLPVIDGLDVCRRLRADASTREMLILMLTAKAEESDELIGFSLGADDYVTKPFSPRELALRVRSVLRRARGALVPTGPSGPLRDGGLVVDVSAHEAGLDGDRLALTSREFDLLAFLLRHPRQAFTRDELLERVWDWTFGDSSTVTVHVRRLREKIEDDPTAPRRIVTVWGVGYRYEPAGND